MQEDIDIKENYIKQLDEELLSILLKDRSSGKNIIWATDTYKSRGDGYNFFDKMTVKAITGRYGLVIKPRVEKSKKEQNVRVKDKAEVFTPSWICNKQNNLIDMAWFGRDNVFNTEKEKTWQVVGDKISFPEGKTWQDYVTKNRLEISCGEAPYLVSRYDAVTGQWLDLNKRIGLLDRKLRIINENTFSESEWYEWAVKAFKSIYGFEWQGDSLLIARENLLFTFIDYYVDRFGNFPIKEYLQEISKIISWNIFQMDGLKYVIPESCESVSKTQDSTTDKSSKQEASVCSHKKIYVKVMNWDKRKSELFIDQIRRKSDDR